jgi:hypothetical protein
VNPASAASAATPSKVDGGHRSCEQWKPITQVGGMTGRGCNDTATHTVVARLGLALTVRFRPSQWRQRRAHVIVAVVRTGASDHNALAVASGSAGSVAP